MKINKTATICLIITVFIALLVSSCRGYSPSGRRNMPSYVKYVSPKKDIKLIVPDTIVLIREGDMYKIQ